MIRYMIGFMFTFLIGFSTLLTACSSGGGGSAAVTYKYSVTGSMAFIPFRVSTKASAFSVKWNEDSNGNITGVFLNEATGETLTVTGTSNGSGRTINATLQAAINGATKIQLIIPQTGDLNGPVNGTLRLLDNNDAEVSSSPITVDAETTDGGQNPDPDPTTEHVPPAVVGTWDRWKGPTGAACNTLGVTDVANAMTIVNQANPITNFNHVAGLGAPGAIAAYFHPDGGGRWFVEITYADGTAYTSVWNPANPNTIVMSYNRSGTFCSGSYTKATPTPPPPPPPPPTTPIGTFKGTRTCVAGNMYAGEEMEVTLTITEIPTAGVDKDITMTVKKEGVTLYGPTLSVGEFENYTFEPGYPYIFDLGFPLDSVQWSITAKYRQSMDNFLVNEFKQSGHLEPDCGALTLTRVP